MSTPTTTLHEALTSAWLSVDAATPEGGAVALGLSDDAWGAINDALEALALAADLTDSEAGL